MSLHAPWWLPLALLLPMGAAHARPKTHPPQRPLPEPSKRPLAKGPAFHVDAARGDDCNDGSEKKPFKTLRRGLRKLKPGDTLYLRGGVYHEKVSLSRSGTKDAPIVIASYPGELAVLDGGLKEFLDSPATSWEPLEGGAAGEYVSTKRFPKAAERKPPPHFLHGAWEPMWGIEDQPSWPDELREEDKGKPDIGALPFGARPWGVDGRIPLFGAAKGK